MEQGFLGNFSGQSHMVFLPFSPISLLNCAHSGMISKISSLCTSWLTKLSLTVKIDDVTRRDVDPSGRLRGE